ncbi:MAG: flavodoxin domain-containing protein [Desulfobacterales bacterium]|nr:flavodoxin domain-containing protein [Desulfobacterales bacterium]
MIGKTEMGRRSFLILAGGAISAWTLSNDKVIAQETRQPAVEFNKSSYEKDGKMKNRLLIAYGSRCGSTGGVAETIGQVLSVAGAAVDLRLVKNVDDLSPYQSVIVGSAIRMGKWLPEAVEFLKTHQGTLSRVPVAYFAVCLTMKDDTAENRRKALGYLDPVRKQFPQVKPADIGLFAGAVDYKKLSFAYSLILKVKGAPEGDFRNWEAIRTWATGIRPALDDGKLGRFKASN